MFFHTPHFVPDPRSLSFVQNCMSNRLVIYPPPPPKKKKKKKWSEKVEGRRAFFRRGKKGEGENFGEGKGRETPFSRRGNFGEGKGAKCPSAERGISEGGKGAKRPSVEGVVSCVGGRGRSAL